MKTQFIVLVAVALLSGCVQQNCNSHATAESAAAPKGGTDYQYCNCEHVRLTSLLGLSDDVLSDTNRFPLGIMRHGHYVTLAKPFLGFKKARVYLDEMRPSSRSGDRTKPHRLRSVELERSLPDDAGSESLLREVRGIIDEISKWLCVESPQVKFVDVDSWKGNSLVISRAYAGNTCICFRLADGQDIRVRTSKSLYVVRDGAPLLVSPASIVIDFTYNPELRFSSLAKVMRRQGGQPVEVTHAIDVGPDCADKLAQSIRDAIRFESRRKSAGPRRDREAARQLDQR